MLNPGVEVGGGSGHAFREAASRCPSGNCYYVEYGFNVIDNQGKSNDVTCEWDVDATQHSVTPRNAQARYYWMEK